MDLSHDIRETPQIRQILFHRLQGCAASSLSIRIKVGLAQELLIGLLEILDERLLVRLRIVNQTTQLIQPLLAQPMEHHVNGRALLADEQDPLPARDVIGDEVRDGLGFARAGRALYDVARSRARPCDCQAS